MTKDSIEGYNIVCLPPEDVTQKVIQWSKEVAEQVPTKFILDGKKYHPHLTFYQSNFPNDNFQTIVTELSDFAMHFAPFTISLEQIEPYENFIFYRADNDRVLQTTHEQILTILSPLRDTDYTVPDDLQGFPPNVARNIKNYGYALAMNDYLPHITISRCDTNEQALHAIQRIQAKKMILNVDSLYVTNVDHDGTCTSILEKIILKGSL